MKKGLGLLFLMPALCYPHNVAQNINIEPLKSISLPTALKNEIQRFNDEQRRNGYVYSDHGYPRKLLTMRTHPLKFSASTDSAEQALKKSLGEILLTFHYTNKVSNPMAYTGIGVVSDKGYSGLKTFFDGKTIGMCSLSVFNRAGVKKPIELNEDGLRYDVNDKPTRITVEGSHLTGFMYSVRWFDKDFIRDLECANVSFDRSITSKMVAIASRLD